MKNQMVWLAAILAVGIAHAALAQEAVVPMLQEGTRELSVSGNYDPDTWDDYSLALAIGYGYFIADNLELGVKGEYEGSDSVDIYSALGFVEYNFDVGGPVVPYATIGGGWIRSEVDSGDTDESNDTGAAFGALGAKYFLTSSLAIGAEVEYTKATDDVFINDDGEIEDDNIEMNLTMRYYF